MPDARKHPPRVADRDVTARRQEERIDEALEQTFPASDPPAFGADPVAKPARVGWDEDESDACG